jgi:Zn-dependent oligopeptidase
MNEATEVVAEEAPEQAATEAVAEETQSLDELLGEFDDAVGEPTQEVTRPEPVEPASDVRIDQLSAYVQEQQAKETNQDIEGTVAKMKEKHEALSPGLTSNMESLRSAVNTNDNKTTDGPSDRDVVGMSGSEFQDYIRKNGLVSDHDY